MNLKVKVVIKNKGVEIMKMKFNKCMAMALTTLLAVSGLAGCGSGSEQKETTTAAAVAATTAAPTTKSGEKVKIRIAWWGGDARHEQTLAAIKKYMDQNPNVEIEGEYQGYDGYYEKMITTLSGGTAPDIFQFHRDWIANVQGESHYLANLKDLNVDLSTIDAGVVERSGSYNGEPVMFSASLVGQVIYANKDFFKNNNLSTDTAFTWDKLKEVGKQVHDANPNQYLMAADIDVLNRLILPTYLAQLTGGSMVNEDQTLNFTQPQMEAALQNILDLYSSNTLEPFGESAVFVGQMEQNSKWVNGEIGSLIDVGSAAAKYKASTTSQIDVMTLPTQEGATCSGVDFSGNLGFCLNDNSANKQAAADFLDWLMNSEDAAVILKDCRGVPASKSALAAIEKAGLLDATLKKANEIAAPNSYTINAISGNTELEVIRKDVIQEVVYGEITAAEGAKTIVEGYTKVLGNLKK